ncbi:LysR family transcriptional regulator [Polynucleobacter sp. MWH-Loch1C5]|uniref:LysR substrate-binding domain-containing protein n=1 Tax=Polynucleobacter sp. MWH-Loch1C5 TaxID=2689108 RepID=UPI001C0B6344|nr:LysR family transcriptional regulator [Polynucleobacter sp. MWH-Loch1C5]MBU3541951.1 LysR family transcriptional regulator [Polynucleobacter sp. MWH-Loch1C5]
MTLTQLKHLVTLVKTGSFVKASASLHITQPALTRSIQALEDYLGESIFDRSGKKIELTNFGMEIYMKAIQLIEDAENIKQSASNLVEGKQGRIHIGLGSGPGVILMRPLLKYMATNHPSMHLELIRGNTEMLTNSLRMRSLDVMIVDARSIEPAEDLSIEILAETKGAFMCRPNHPLAKSKAVTINDIRQYPIASSPLSAEIDRILSEKYGSQASLRNLINLKCNEISSLIDICRETDTIALAIRKAAPDLVELDMLPPLNTNAKFAFVTIQNRSHPPFLEKIHNFCKAQFKD